MIRLSFLLLLQKQYLMSFGFLIPFTYKTFLLFLLLHNYYYAPPYHLYSLVRSIEVNLPLKKGEDSS